MNMSPQWFDADTQTQKLEELHLNHLKLGARLVTLATSGTGKEPIRKEAIRSVHVSFPLLFYNHWI